MRHIVLDKKRKIVVPVRTEIKEGMEVLSPYMGLHQRHIFGNPDEDMGVVQSIFKDASPDGKPVAVIIWPNDYVTQHFLENLLAYVDFQQWRIENKLPETVNPKYNVDQVLFLRPDSHVRSGMDYPAVGSPWETDVKVTEVLKSKFGSVIQYKVYIPSIGYQVYPEESLISVRERERILHEDFKEYFVTDNLLPFFKRGERVKAFDNRLYNTDETVVVNLTDELRKFLSWSIKPE